MAHPKTTGKRIEDRGQRTEGKEEGKKIRRLEGQRAEARERQRSGKDRGRMTEIRSQKSDIRSRRPEGKMLRRLEE